MSTIETGRQLSYHDRHRSDLRQARILMVVAYPFCLAVAAARRLAPAAVAGKQYRPRSIFAEARADAGSVLPFIFR